MTMATISPSEREVSPAGSSCRSSRLVLLKFRLVAANPSKSLLFIFFWNETLLVAKEGGQRASWEPTSPLGAARGEAGPSRLVASWWLPSDERSVGDDEGDDFPLRERSFPGRIVLLEL